MGVSTFILRNIHLTEATKVVQHLTNSFFDGSSNHCSTEANNKSLGHALLVLYIAHDLIFKSQEIRLPSKNPDDPMMVTQILQQTHQDDNEY